MAATGSGASATGTGAGGMAEGAAGEILRAGNSFSFGGTAR